MLVSKTHVALGCIQREKLWSPRVAFKADKAEGVLNYGVHREYASIREELPKAENRTPQLTEYDFPTCVWLK